MTFKKLVEKILGKTQNMTAVTRSILYRMRYYFKEIGWWFESPSTDKREMIEGLVPLIFWSMALAHLYKINLEAHLKDYMGFLEKNNHKVTPGETLDPEALDLAFIADMKLEASSILPIEEAVLHPLSNNTPLAAYTPKGERVEGYYIGSKEGKHYFYTTDEKVTEIHPKTIVRQ